MRPCFIDFSSFRTIQEDDEDSSAGEEDVVSESSFIKNSNSFNLSSPKVSSPSVCSHMHLNSSLTTMLVCVSHVHERK